MLAFAYLTCIECHLALFVIELEYRLDRRLFNLSRLKAKTKVMKTAVIDLQYADDCAILAHSAEELQTSLDLFTEAYQSLGVSINIRKKNQGYPSTYSKHQCRTSSLKSQVVYSKQPKLGLTQEFVVDCAHALWVVRSIKRLVSLMLLKWFLSDSFIYFMYRMFTEKI